MAAAYSRYAQRRFVDAVKLFRQAIELDPASIDAKVGLAYSLAGSGQPEEALSTLIGAVQAKPSIATPETYTDMAMLAWEVRDAVRAERFSQQAISLGDNRFEPAMQLALARAAQGKSDRAAHAAEQAFDRAGTVNQKELVVIALIELIQQDRNESAQRLLKGRLEDLEITQEVMDDALKALETTWGRSKR